MGPVKPDFLGSYLPASPVGLHRSLRGLLLLTWDLGLLKLSWYLCLIQGEEEGD